MPRFVFTPPPPPSLYIKTMWATWIKRGKSQSKQRLQHSKMWCQVDNTFNSGFKSCCCSKLQGQKPDRVNETTNEINRDLVLVVLSWAAEAKVIGVVLRCELPSWILCLCERSGSLKTSDSTLQLPLASHWSQVPRLAKWTHDSRSQKKKKKEAVALVEANGSDL